VVSVGTWYLSRPNQNNITINSVGEKTKFLATPSVFKASDKHPPLHRPGMISYGNYNGEVKMGWM